MAFVKDFKGILQEKHTIVTMFTTIVFSLILLLGLTKYIVPSFEEEIMHNIVDESKRVSQHLLSEYEKDNGFEHIEKLQEDLLIEKVKFFDKDGKIIFSTNQKDIGNVARQEYFHNIVAKGNIYYEIEKKEKITINGETIVIDMAEVYVPIMKNGKFEHAFEVYFDITKKVERFNILETKIQIVSSLLIVFIFLMVLLREFYLYKAKEKQELFEEQLQSTRKLAEMGEMIANIAHQWRQPLSTISSSATGMLLLKRLDTLTDEQFDKSCNVINDNAQYLSKTIDDFRNFIKGERELREFNFGENLKEFLNLIDPTSKTEHINLVLNYDDQLVLRGYPNELMQCYINIFNNAKDAFEVSEAKDKYLFIEALKDDSNIVIKFRDNAGGIPQDVISRVFEPYFTTKHQSHGTGLGLSMIYNLIVDGLNGSIEVKNVTYNHNNEEYTGAEFTITLPI